MPIETQDQGKPPAKPEPTRPPPVRVPSDETQKRKIEVPKSTAC